MTPLPLFPRLTLCMLAALALAARGHAQEEKVAASVTHGSHADVQVAFLPPPLENATFSVGIFGSKSGKLVRRLHEFATESAFTVGLNGLITKWDGKDDNGNAAPVGRYAARGYAVGGLKVEGTDILGNDWAADDENLRLEEIEAIVLLPDESGLAVLGITPHYQEVVACYGSTDHKFLWEKTDAEPLAPAGSSLGKVSITANAETVTAVAGSLSKTYRIKDGDQVAPAPDESAASAIAGGGGKDRTAWKIEDGALNQYSPDGTRLRSLLPKDGEPLPVAVTVSETDHQLYLLEKMKGWQRVRGLSWVETKEENGQQVSTWQTFFERNIRPAAAASSGAGNPVEINLEDNPLSPGKTQKLKLAASVDAKGSYLTTGDGLRLRRVSQRAGLNAARVEKGETAGSLKFLQTDGAAWDEFAIHNVQDIMAFDAGEFELTANGEKPVTEKPQEPADL